MTDTKESLEAISVKKTLELGQELIQRLIHMKPEDLQEPTILLENLSDYRLVNGFEMSFTQKKLVTIRTQLIEEAMEIKSFAEEAIEADDQELLTEILEEFKRKTKFASLVNSLLVESIVEKGVGAGIEDMEFLADWKLAVKEKASKSFLVNKSPTIDRRVLLAQTMLEQAGKSLEQILNPLSGTSHKPKKEDPEQEN